MPCNIWQKGKTSIFRKQIADRDNNVVILDKYSYISVTEEILNENTKYSKPDITTAKGINHLGERTTSTETIEAQENY